MRDFTKVLKAEEKKDVFEWAQHNNSKIRQRTQAQNEQSYNAKKAHYLNKWNAYAAQAETPAQKRICVEMIARYERMPKFY